MSWVAALTLPSLGRFPQCIPRELAPAGSYWWGEACPGQGRGGAVLQEGGGGWVGSGTPRGAVARALRRGAPVPPLKGGPRMLALSTASQSALHPHAPLPNPMETTLSSGGVGGRPRGSRASPHLGGGALSLLTCWSVGASLRCAGQLHKQGASLGSSPASSWALNPLVLPLGPGWPWASSLEVEECAPPSQE